MEVERIGRQSRCTENKRVGVAGTLTEEDYNVSFHVAGIEGTQTPGHSIENTSLFIELAKLNKSRSIIICTEETVL